MTTERTTNFDQAFDPATEEGTPPRDLLPAGKYRAEVTDASIGSTKNGKGQMLHLTWTITEGEYEKRLAFQSIIFQHESADATRFGRQKIKDLCDACGIKDAVTDVSVFLYKPCMIYLGVERDKSGQYVDKNKVSRITPVIVLNAPLPPVNGGEAAPADVNLNDKIPW